MRLLSQFAGAAQEKALRRLMTIGSFGLVFGSGYRGGFSARAASTTCLIASVTNCGSSIST